MITNHTVYTGDRGMVVVGAAMHRGIGGDDVEDVGLASSLLRTLNGTMGHMKDLILNRKHVEKL